MPFFWKRNTNDLLSFYLLGMASRRHNRVSTRDRNNSQQAEDVIEVGSNQPNNAQGKFYFPFGLFNWFTIVL